MLKISKGDLVTRKSYQNDTIFKVINIKNNIYYLKGVDVRLYANSPLEDLELYKEPLKKDNFLEKIQDLLLEDRGEFFYLPAKILHIDGDNDYLKRCLRFYDESGVLAIGKKIKEENIANELFQLLNTYKPDIVIITGHDAYYRKNGDINNINNYKNTANFIKAVTVARKFEKSHDKLVVIAGACQSDYEDLIKAGANFASSPKRVNIHALDPALIAVTLALTEKNQPIELLQLLSKTKYGVDGMGGIKSNGMMYIGYPR